MKTQEGEYNIALGKETGNKVGRWKIQTMGVSTATILLVLFLVRFFLLRIFLLVLIPHYSLPLQLWLFIIRLLAVAKPVALTSDWETINDTQLSLVTFHFRKTNITFNFFALCIYLWRLACFLFDFLPRCCNTCTYFTIFIIIHYVF